MKKVIDVISKIFYYFLIAIEAVVLIFSVGSRLTGNDNPSIMGYSLYVIATPSMQGVLDVGDVIVSEEIDDPSTIQEGDIVTYLGKVDSFEGKLVTHKVIEVLPQEDGTYHFITKGVANSAEDPEIDETQLVSKFVYKTFLLSLFYKLISELFGFILLVVVPILYIIANEVIAMIKEIKEEKKNEKSTKENLSE